MPCRHWPCAITSRQCMRLAKIVIQVLRLEKSLIIFFYNKEISGSITSETEADQHLQMPDKAVTYQASSPGEVALVQWTQEVGLTLSRRDLSSMQLRGPDGRLLNYAILQIFPFTSETKRMGIIVKVGLYDSNGIG